MQRWLQRSLQFLVSLTCCSECCAALLRLFIASCDKQPSKCTDVLSVNSAVSLVSLGRSWESLLRPRGRPRADQRRALPRATLCLWQPAAQAGIALFRCSFFFPLVRKPHPLAGTLPCLKTTMPACATKRLGGSAGSAPLTTARWGSLIPTLPHGNSR